MKYLFTMQSGFAQNAVYQNPAVHADTKTARPVQMRRIGNLVWAGALALLACSGAAKPFVSPARHIHDPVIAQDGKWFYLYSTGPGIFIHRSSDLVHWQWIGKVFSHSVPFWAKRAVPGSRGVWAPSITYSHGVYRLYYAVSTFGSRQSVIGLATSATLDPHSAAYRWKQQGMVVQSSNADNYNAIDPYPFNTADGRSVLLFGSFWSGIKLVSLDPSTGRRQPGAPIVPIAYRPGSNAIEAGCLFQHGGWYYLFLSFDYCCRGVHSTYNIRVGRSAALDGPYLDAAGKPLLKGGGTPLLATQGSVIGPGHCSILTIRGHAYLVYHYYDGSDHGIPTLQIRPLHFDMNGWPQPGEPLR